MCETRLGTDPGPEGKRCNRCQENSGHKVTRDLVGEPLDRRATALRFGDHLHDLGEHGLLSNALCYHDEAAGIIERAPDDVVTPILSDRQCFAGEHRFVDCSLAFQNASIHRHLFAGPHAQVIAAFHIAQRHVLFLTIEHEPGCGWRKTKQAPDGASCSMARAQFQDLTEQDQDRYHRGRFKIDSDLSVMCAPFRKLGVER